jgi:AraC-like DNA-binding protein
MLGFLFLINISQTNSIANRWLGMFYLGLACSFSQLFIYKAELFQNFPLLVHLLELPAWATLPCFYLAVLKFTGRTVNKKRFLIHFIPFFSFLVFSILYIMPFLMGSVQRTPEIPFWLGTFIRYFFTGQLIFYWLLSYQTLTDHKKHLLSVASSIEDVNLKWLKNLLVASLVMILAKIIPIEGRLNSIIPLIYFAGMMVLAYYSIRQQGIHPIELFTINSTSEETGDKEVWERLEADQVEELQRKVIRITMQQRLYLDPSLTLPALSKATEINVQDLSYVLNKGIKKNFYQFINELRVEEAKILLLSDKVKTLDMLGIATHAGFNSKTTFNTTFKKLTGLTPSQYQKLPSSAIANC